MSATLHKDQRSVDDPTIAEYAAMRRRSVKTVRRWGAQGLVDLYRVGPKLLYVSLASESQLTRGVPTAKQAS